MKAIDLVKLALLSMQRNSWEQGVAMDAFFEQGDRDVVIALAKEAANRRTPDGRPAMIRPDEGITDPCSVGEALIFSFRETDDKDLGDACDSLLNWALKSAPRNHNGIVYHVPNRPEFWIDSMYMLPPYLAAAGHPKKALRIGILYRNGSRTEKQNCNVRVILLSFWAGKLTCGSCRMKGGELNTLSLWKRAKRM